MKVIIDGYEVDIKAKYTANGGLKGKKYNDGDTMAVLCKIAGWCWESYYYNKSEGYKYTAEKARQTARALCNILNDRGYFDDINKKAE